MADREKSCLLIRTVFLIFLSASVRDLLIDV